MFAVATMRIEAIRVGNRFRKDLGDLTGLMASMNDRLINPVTVDERGNLLAGGRRIEAARRLGWTEIEVRIVETLEDAVAALTIEKDENTCRLPMADGELTALLTELAKLMRAEAAASQGGNGRFDANTVPSSAGGNRPTKEVAELLAPITGRGKTTNYDLLAIGRAAASGDPGEAAVGRHAQMRLDAGHGVQPVAKEMREALGRTKVTNAPGRAPAAALRRRDDQQKIIGEFVRRHTGIEAFAGEVARRLDDAGGLSPDIGASEIGQWVTDLDSARKGINALIAKLKKEATSNGITLP